MAYSMEIERRFFIDGRLEKPWRNGLKSSSIKQYYLRFEDFSISDNSLHYHKIMAVKLTEEETDIIANTDNLISRIRIIDEKAIITMKGKRSNASALELEWDIDDQAAREILALDDFPGVEKTRYYWTGEDNLIWEVDEFEGGLAGLILAEVELKDENQPVMLPPWLGMELTGLSNWSNASLAKTLAND